MCGKTKRFILAVNQSAVDFDVKNSTIAFDQLCVNAFGLLNGGRQTGGLRCVVSHNAIGDFNLHFRLFRDSPTTAICGKSVAKSDSDDDFQIHFEPESLVDNITSDVVLSFSHVRQQHGSR